MCERAALATQDSAVIVACWATERRWDSRDTGDLVDIYRERFPLAQSITFCVNGERRGGWVSATIGEAV